MKIFNSPILFSLLASFAFAPGAQAGNELSSTGNQICLNFEDDIIQCYIEEMDQGRLHLYTTERDYFDLAVNEVLVHLNAEFNLISAEEYFAKLNSLEAATYIFSPQRVDVFDYASAMVCNYTSNGWWGKYLTKCPGPVNMGTSVPTKPRISLFPDGTTTATYFGNHRGINCSHQYFLHLNGATYDFSESQNWKGLKRCN